LFICRFSSLIPVCTVEHGSVIHTTTEHGETTAVHARRARAHRVAHAGVAHRTGAVRGKLGRLPCSLSRRDGTRTCIKEVVRGSTDRDTAHGSTIHTAKRAVIGEHSIPRAAVVAGLGLAAVGGVGALTNVGQHTNVNSATASSSDHTTAALTRSNVVVSAVHP